MTTRTVVLIILGVVLLTSLGIHQGWVTSPMEYVEQLANRPDVGMRFDDAAHGRFDAAVFLFTCIILAPIAGLALVLVLAITMMLLEGTVFQVSRRVGLPDGLTFAVLSAGLIGLAWTHSNVWLPRSLRLIGTIARAWIVSTT
jgi:hypothetical protein